MVWGVFLPINMDHTSPEKTQLSQVAAALLTLSPRRTRGPSSPACVASFFVRVDTLEASGALGSDEPHMQVKKDVSNCTAGYPRRVHLHRDGSAASARLVVIP
jgi:hypothetical protein